MTNATPGDQFQKPTYDKPHQQPSSPASDGKGAGPVLINLADVQPERVRWLWAGRIARGKLTMIAGDPGLGKSFLSLDIAARVSKGRSWPDGTAGTCGSVVLLSAEDDLADTIRPRLDAADADVTRIVALDSIRHIDRKSREVVSQSFSLQRDLPSLELAIERSGDCRLVVIDPITAYLGTTDSHKNAEIRGLLAPLSAMAARHDIAVVAVTHLNKSSTMAAMYRTMGSLAFVATARAVWAVTKDKDDPSGRRRLFLPVKNNLGADQTGMAYRLQGTPAGDGTAVVAWEPDPVAITADDALGDHQKARGKGSKVEEAMYWLRGALAGGRLLADDIKQRAERDGIASRTLDRAKGELGVTVDKEGFGDDGRWKWSLPDQCAPDAPDPETLAALDDVGGLSVEPEENGGSRGDEQPENTKGRQNSKDRQDIKDRQSPERGDEWGVV